MKLTRKTLTALGIVVAVVLTVGILSAFTARSQGGEPSGNATERKLVRIGSSVITQADLDRYKAGMPLASEALPGDSALVKELAIEQLMLQMADAEGLAATHEEGKREAERMKALLMEQPAEVRNLQLQFIEDMKMDEARFWNENAPSVYRDQLSKERLMETLVARQKEDGRDVIATGNALRNELLEDALQDGTVRVLDPAIQW